jgi:quinol monooxygenase YgiN
MTVHVLAMITAKPGQRATILAAFAENRPNVLAEAGCIAYEATVDLPDVGPIQTPLGPDSFVVIERWESLEALKAHAAAPHMAAYAAKTRPLVATRAVHVLGGV